MKKFTKILAMLTAVLMIASLAVGCSKTASRTPEEILQAAFANQAPERAAAKDELLGKLDLSANVDPFVTSMLKGGSAALDLSIPIDLGGFQLPVTAGLKINFGETKAALALAAGMLGQNLIDLRADVDAEHIAVAEPSLFGEQAYGVSFENLGERFEKSVFGPGGKLDLGIDLSALGATDAISAVKDADLKNLLKDFADGVSEVCDAAAGTVTDHADVTMEEREITVNGESVKANAITVARDAEQTKAYLGELTDAVKANEKITAAAATVTTLVEKLTGEATEKDFNAILDEALAAADGVTFTTVYYVGDEDVLLGSDTTVDSADTKATVTTLGGETKWNLTADEDGAAIRADGVRNEDGIIINAEYTDEKGDGTIRASILADGTFEITAGGESAFSLTGSHDKEAGAFKAELTAGDTAITLNASHDPATGHAVLALNAGETAISLDGDWTEETGKRIFTLGTLTVNGEALNLSGVITLCESDEMPAPLAYTDLLDMSDADAEEFAGMLDGIGEVFGKLGSFLTPAA